MAQQDLRPLLEPAVAGVGCDLEDLTVSLAGRRRRIEVVIDRDGGVDLDLIAEASRAVSAVLDESDAVGDSAYVLEVTSPGVDRPLTLGRHWRRNIGRLVVIDLVDGQQITGRIAPGSSDAGIELDVDGETRHLDLSDVTSGRVQIEFRRPDEGNKGHGH